MNEKGTIVLVKCSLFFRLRNGFTIKDILNFLGNLSKSVTYEDIERHHLQVEKVLAENGYPIEKFMLEVTQPCLNLIQNCSWLGENVACSTLFRMIKSSSGFCCSFNYKALKLEYDK